MNSPRTTGGTWRSIISIYKMLDAFWEIYDASIANGSVALELLGCQCVTVAIALD